MIENIPDLNQVQTHLSYKSRALITGTPSPKWLMFSFETADLDILMKTDFHETWHTDEWHCNSVSHLTMADNSLI